MDFVSSPHSGSSHFVPSLYHSEYTDELNCQEVVSVLSTFLRSKGKRYKVCVVLSQAALERSMDFR